MNRLTVFLFLALFATIAAQCESQGAQIAQAGPRSWIDAPQPYSSLPLAQTEILSHSTDPLRIVQVELSVNGAVVRADPNPDSERTLVTMRQPWVPPGPGNYTLRVRAQNSTGIWGDYATTVVTVGGAMTTPTASPTAPPRASPSPPSPVVTGTPLPPVSISFTADPTRLFVGQCATIQWQVTNAAQVFLDNAAVAASGSKRECPTRTTTYSLRVITLDNQTVQRSLTLTVVAPSLTAPPPTRTPTRTPVPPPAGCVGTPNISSFSASPATITAGQSATLTWGAITNADYVSITPGIGGVVTPGSISVSPASTTTYILTARCGSNTVTRQTTVTVQPPPPQDTTGPTISNISTSSSLFYRSSGCSPLSIQVTAHVTDPSGVANVTLWYRVGSRGLFTSVGMDAIGGNNYRKTVKGSDIPGTSVGEWQFYITARDGVGNTSQSPTNTSVTLYSTCVK